MKILASHSLRTRLLWLLLVAVMFTAVVQAVITYRSARADADEIFDYHMQQTAIALRSALLANSPVSQDNNINEDENFDFVVQAWSADGLTVFQSAADAALPQRAVLGFSDVDARGTTYRVFSMLSRSLVIQVAQDMTKRREMATGLALRTMIPIAVMAPILMLLVWWSVKLSLRPVSRVRLQVAQRQPGELNDVSEVGLPEEIRPLVHELNLLFARVRLAFDAQTSFVADAAHELRSPLAALKLQVLGMQRATDDTSREVALGRLNAGIERATRLVEQLLMLARFQANAVVPTPQPIALAELARLAIADATTAAQTRRINLGHGRFDESCVAGYADALRILMRNLIDNAIKYTPMGGKVNLEIRRDGNHLSLIVEDSGPGIAQFDHERVLDRFYRVAGTETTGSGLGLAIVKSVADLHGASLQLNQSQFLGGLRVTVGFSISS